MFGTPSSIKPHIAVFGKRNAGKSSLINALTGQNLAIVSDVAGTTTDPVYKSFELLPFGAVVFIDTAGLDDTGDLGKLRVKKSYEILNKTDLALIVVEKELSEFETNLIKEIEQTGTDYLVVYNKSDIYNYKNIKNGIPVNTKTKEGIDILKKRIIEILEKHKALQSEGLVSDLVNEGGFAVLVVPIDEEAPKGRLILPQVQTIRDILDNDAFCLVVKERELYNALNLLNKDPDIVITDSQAFLKVAADVPDHIPMTSFSILFARYKGDLNLFIEGAKEIENLENGDTVLIMEACSHHQVGDDIGTVKIPRLLRQYTGKKLNFEFYKGKGFDFARKDIKLVIHCGGCMLNRKSMISRMDIFNKNNIKITNYGITIAYTLGILPRALKPFDIDFKY
ncbi:small GTP-binding protein [Thermotomaculum hydrothermale]|uniref:Small GTP-binding protein n=1 Tax=Thermotomaculum hydrothermale TaxID=981385 RepID=A0A7R6SYT4_9BACT|nr:[FeFe] hydrogenase H-cluster maturation GTPase HydF [Thermotomaculum hydrothermale]BBB32057.1 small GTP-binding protein [Thermotomaculum hydrothermale]